MINKKKLQVFVSSTYADLLEERQAAVEAILTAGHIPAGMELFAAGDESQMNVIKRWIDESDVFLLILGGRYGSIESKSQKSYIHLEYEYAIEQAKPLFAVVITEDYIEDKVKKFGTKVMETDHPQKLKEFRTMVLTRMVKFWRDPRDIKLAILETVAEFSHRSELVGWIPGTEAINAGPLAEEIARLTKENSALRDQILKSSLAPSNYSGLNFEQMHSLLTKAKVSISDISMKRAETLQAITDAFGDTEPQILHLFWMMSGLTRSNQLFSFDDDKEDLMLVKKLEDFGLVESDTQMTNRFLGVGFYYRLTEGGKQFLIRLRLERNTEKAEKHILKEL